MLCGYLYYQSVRMYLKGSGNFSYQQTVHCQRNQDSWGILWRKKTPGVKYTRCPGGIKRSEGLAKRECGADGAWKKVDVTSCATRAIMNIESNVCSCIVVCI